MREDFNKEVFDTLPDSVWRGKMPSLPGSRPLLKAVVCTAAALSIPLAVMLFRKPSVEVAPIAQSAITYTVNPSLRGKVTLPDSTLVTLGPGSTLTLGEDFGKGSRTVRLDGEALFDVHKDESRPFFVLTPSDVTVKVTGTQFNVSSYSDAPGFDLTLIKGSVSVITPQKETIEVKPSEKIVIGASGQKRISEVSAPEEAAVWTRGVLKFNNTPLREAIGRIEKWYDVKIEVTDEQVYRSSITAEFHSETLSEVLDLLCITSRLAYTESEGEIKLCKK